MRRLKT